jgi:HD-GYP domain-containing protein (c-di-GMP phosphodiesterase class II)
MAVPLGKQRDLGYRGGTRFSVEGASMQTAVPQASPSLAPAPASDDATALGAADSKACHQWQLWQEMALGLEPLLMQPKERTDFLHGIRVHARQIMNLAHQDADIAIFHMVHATEDQVHRYSVLHAMHVGMLMALVGMRKDWGDARTLSGVQAALTMNLSVTALQNELALLRGPLNEDQKNAIHAHPLASWQLLRQLGVQDEDWLIAVAQHHEQSDGTGYPQGLTQVHQLADALRTCDVFGAKISPRAGRPGLLTPRAAAEIFKQRSAGYFGATIIRELGLYPPGCLVELRTGEQAVVVRRGVDPSAPDVVVLSDRDGQALGELMRCRTTRASGRQVVGAAPRQDWAQSLPPSAILALA